ncbi:MAG: [FeFe] hydrogenase H-cluster maturation GTPase HydF [Clostridiales bacterium]|nr:[FeFe] hydrogenase H-cluster maturation GTPase HydF [Clostridiales bacterium]
MSLNNTPKADRIHIGIFGCTNAGKSSIINAITGQNLALVSGIKGTTTDPVSKAMELLPLGPVVIIDTPGLDDDSVLGKQRIKKAIQVLNKTDIALLVVDALKGIANSDKMIIEKISEKKIPYVVAINKADLLDDYSDLDENQIYVSATTGDGITELKELLAKQKPDNEKELRIVGDLIKPLDLVVLVTPIDESAPKGRLILPQQQTIRDILESGAIPIITRETELRDTLASLGKKPKLVITDSQVFAQVSADTPDDILLTSFSILFARYKGELKELIRGVKIVKELQNGDRVLISEGCTHHRQCEDIGTVKIPKLLLKHTGVKIDFETTSGTEFPADLSQYKLIIHCGGCMLNDREMKYRIKTTVEQDIPIVNYGVLLAFLNGILKRSVQIFPEILLELEGY